MTMQLIRRSILLLTGLLLIALSLPAKDYTLQTVPNVRLSDGRNHVSNPDQILSAQTVSQMNRLMNQVEDSLGIEIAVVAIDGIGDQDAREFANELFGHWGLGKKAEDNGLLILLLTAPEQRAVVFETGYGIEGVLPDIICNRLQQDHMIPDLRIGDYNAGMLSGVEAVCIYLLASDYEREAMVHPISAAHTPDPLFDNIIWNILGGMFMLVFVSIFLSALLKKRKRVCPKCGNKTLEYRGQRIIREATYQQTGLAENIWKCTTCDYSENTPRTLDKLHRSTGPVIIGGGHHRRGGGFGGGFGGGGGSWGGGRSGGGGSISRF